MVKILESYLMSKTENQNSGEDRLVQGPYFFGVIDGATDKSGLNWGTEENYRKGGAALADTVKDVLEDLQYQSATPEKLVLIINKKIRAAAKKAGIDLNIVNNRADVAFAAYSVESNSVYHIHDCSFGFVMGDGRFETYLQEKPVDKLTSSLRQTIIQWYLEQRADPFAEGRDPGREFVLELLRKQPEIQNMGFDNPEDWHPGIPFNMVAYRTLNGYPTTISTTPVPEKTREIVLASDGFPVLKPTLDQTLAILQEYLKQDPHCIDVLKGTKGLKKGNKSYDDMAYLRIGLEG